MLNSSISWQNIRCSVTQNDRNLVTLQTTQNTRDIKKQFPVFERQVYSAPKDSGTTAQK